MTEPTEMELRVASILEDESAPWMNQLMPGQALHLARAAIRAMREPTKEITTVILDLMNGPRCEATANGIWRTQIDAASPSPTSVSPHKERR